MSLEEQLAQTQQAVLELAQEVKGLRQQLSGATVTAGAGVESTQPAAPEQPAAPAQPAAPEQPAAPAQPAAPEQPAAPTQPAEMLRRIRENLAQMERDTAIALLQRHGASKLSELSTESYPAVLEEIGATSQ